MRSRAPGSGWLPPRRTCSPSAAASTRIPSSASRRSARRAGSADVLDAAGFRVAARRLRPPHRVRRARRVGTAARRDLRRVRRAARHRPRLRAQHDRRDRGRRRPRRGARRGRRRPHGQRGRDARRGERRRQDPAARARRVRRRARGDDGASRAVRHGRAADPRVRRVRGALPRQGVARLRRSRSWASTPPTRSWSRRRPSGCCGSTSGPPTACTASSRAAARRRTSCRRTRRRAYYVRARTRGDLDDIRRQGAALLRGRRARDRLRRSHRRLGRAVRGGRGTTRALAALYRGNAEALGRTFPDSRRRDVALRGLDRHGQRLARHAVDPSR